MPGTNPIKHFLQFSDFSLSAEQENALADALENHGFQMEGINA